MNTILHLALIVMIALLSALPAVTALRRTRRAVPRPVVAAAPRSLRTR